MALKKLDLVLKEERASTSVHLVIVDNDISKKERGLSYLYPVLEELEKVSEPRHGTKGVGQALQ